MIQQAITDIYGCGENNSCCSGIFDAFKITYRISQKDYISKAQVIKKYLAMIFGIHILCPELYLDQVNIKLVDNNDIALQVSMANYKNYNPEIKAVKRGI